MRGTGGGPEKTILLGAARTDPAEFRITVCYIRDRRDTAFHLDARARELGVDYVEVHERHSLDRRIWPQLQQIVHDRGIDIVHAHEYKTDLLAWLLGRTGAVTPLATAHGWTGHSARERFGYYPVDKRLLARFPRVIAVSEQIRGELIAAGASPARVTTVLNGIDHVAFRRDPARVPAARQALGLSESDLAVGAVGRLEPQKRFDLLIEACAGLVPKYPRLRLLIAGDGSQREALEAVVARLGMGAACRLLGHQADIPALHHAFDLLVQSSDYEGTPNAVLEAMAFETPLVATDVGGTRELATDGVHGFVLPPGNAGRLAEAIDRALAAPEAMRRMAAAARARVEGELSFARRTETLNRIYRELAALRRGERTGRNVANAAAAS